MTHDEQVPDGRELPSWHVEIDALLDGEAVKKRVLLDALGDQAAREYFVDAVLLRQLTRGMGPEHFVIPARPRGPLARGVRWLGAVAVLVIGTAIGFVYGQRSQESQFAAGSVEVVLDSMPAPAAPEPTRHIRFEPGVNWTLQPETAGTNDIRRQ